MGKLLESRLPLAITDVDANTFNRLVRILEINLGKFDPSSTPQFNDSSITTLGFNAGDEVYITEDVVKDLEEEVKSNYHNSFCADGFFWGQQFQEESVKEYKSQDLKFLKFCKEAIKDGKTVVYTCSW